MIDSEVRNAIFNHIIENARQKSIRIHCVNGWMDHAHVLISLGPDQTIAKVAQLLKGESSHWINEKGILRHKFDWQNDYYAVSVSESGFSVVREYIRTQEEHHRKKTFGEEVDQILVRCPRPSGRVSRLDKPE